MMADNSSFSTRKKYKRYLKDSSVEIPRSTKRYRRMQRDSLQKKQGEKQEDLADKNDLSLISESADESISTSYRLAEQFPILPWNKEVEPENNYTDEVVNSNDISNGEPSTDCEDCEENRDKNYTNAEIEYPENDSDLQSENDCSNSDIGDELFNENLYSESETENEALELECTALYDSCDITRQESEMLIMATALRHNMPDIALESTINLIDCHLPHVEYKSKYRYLKSFSHPTMKEYFYCDDCTCILKFEGEETTCEHCLTLYNKSILRKREQYFIYLPLKAQLEELVNSKVFADFRKIHPDTADIVNSPVYKKLQENDIIKENDITITWNTDGVNMFNSSKKNVWPLQISINELPYRVRKNNIILCAIWKSDKKPNMNLYLQPFVEELNDLSLNGFRSTTFLSKRIITVKVFAILCSVDSVARPAVQNLKQFNGVHGCSYCFNKGKRIPVKRGYARIYCGTDGTRRTEENHMELVALAVQQGKIIKGVKGPSIVSMLQTSNIIYSFPPEYMHCCLLGVAKLFATEWFDSANKGQAWYLGSKRTLFKNLLATIKPPTEITRTPRPLSDKYKASEWKNFILYYSLPCLKDIMKKKFFEHWFLFVYALNVYLQSEISVEKQRLAKQALIKFVNDTKTLYNETFLKYNVHLLLHLPSFVKSYGALWAWSAFSFEGFNGVIKNLYHGTQYVPQQMQKMYYRLKYVKNNKHIFDSENVTDKGKSFFIKLMNECKIKNCIEYGDLLRIFGKALYINLSVTEKLLVESLLEEPVNVECSAFQRFIYQGTLFHSTNYKRLQKRNNSCIITSNNLILRIRNLLQIQCKSNTINFVVIGEKFNVLKENLCINKKYKSGNFSYVAQLTSNVVCCTVESIKSKCIEVQYNDKICIFPLVNKFETD